MTSKARGLAQLGNAYNDGALSNRNKIINGNFDIWQRGTSGTSGYVADRWVNAVNGTTQTQTQKLFSLGQTDVPNEPRYYVECAVTSVAGAPNAAILWQTIEGVRTFAGQTVTVSFWAKADASKDIAVEFDQYFGTGGSPSSAVTSIGVTTCSLTTSWQKFTVTANIPSISGKTIGTDGNDFLRLNLWFDSGSDYNARNNSLGQQSGTFDIAQVQLEAGDTATPFEHRSYGAELALCQRYYQRYTTSGYVYGRFALGENRTTTKMQAFFDLGQSMRAVPTLQTTGTASDYAVYHSEAIIAATAVVYDSSATARVPTIQVSVASGLLDGGASQFMANNNTSSFIAFDSEL